MPTTVIGGFSALLADLALTERQKAMAEGRVNHLVEYFRDKDIVCVDLPFKIGSFERGTVIRWSRDIDVMVALSSATYWDRYGSDSAKMLYWIRDRMNKEYDYTVVSTKQVAVRMFLGDGLQVDLVPTFMRSGGGYRMPDGKGGWMATNPPFHATEMTGANVDLDFKLKPLVRVMKAWNHANYQHLRSFHLEMMLWEIWKTHTEIASLPEAVSRSLNSLATIWLQYSMWDPWDGGGPKQIDAYLSDAERGVIQRLAAADHTRAMDAIAYDGAGKVADAFAKWDTVFNGKFPSYG